MPNDGGVADKLAGAKAALNSANNSLVAGRKSTYSEAPYSAAHTARKAAEAPNLGDELKAKADNVQQYRDAQ